mgnify:CR=1 FL=1
MIRNLIVHNLFWDGYNILKNELITNDSHLPSIQKIFSPGQGRLDEPQLSEIILELSENLHIIPGEYVQFYGKRNNGWSSRTEIYIIFLMNTR